MGRRRRKVVRIVKRQLPEFYLCPRCGKNTVRATINREQGRVVVICGSCGLSDAFDVQPQMEEVDAYCLFVDSYYGVERGEAAIG
ncbi:hypothetical protein AC482_00150 [miscellaneous Crenarchaeota group-15 archaeon DG-45]|uniref:Transcription elongation factor n=1 Tax=miscellaneous Crenarchaeota group-15 archaeon DG-45 TaxID=1685127 RepID=A0A0M0BTB6_9ARCH|nr:MAG: hypothetical protein AC482_00150 [miscellaneous Crenarchaeota group-15 archaeon DG-45]